MIKIIAWNLYICWPHRSQQKLKRLKQALSQLWESDLQTGTNAKLDLRDMDTWGFNLNLHSDFFKPVSFPLTHMQWHKAPCCFHSISPKKQKQSIKNLWKNISFFSNKWSKFKNISYLDCNFTCPVIAWCILKFFRDPTRYEHSCQTQSNHKSQTYGTSLIRPSLPLKIM